MNSTEISIHVRSGGQSSKVSLSTASASTAAVSRPTNHPAGEPISCLVTPDVNCFVRRGTGSATAVSDGTDQILLANNTYRIELMEGEVLAAIVASGTGNLYFTPGA